MRLGGFLCYTNGMNKNRGFLLLFALFIAIFASVSSVADDLAGVMSVDAGTNGVVEFEMPFAPMEPIGPQGYVSGIFLGDGGDYSDRLFKYDSVSEMVQSAVWGGYSWFDPATGLHSFMSASPGDILYFFRIDDEPFRFSVFGRLPSSFTSSSSPRFTSIGVNPTNETVKLEVSSDDRTFDVFSAESTNAASALSSEWTHLFRAPSAKFPALFSDSAPIPGNTKLFLASDAVSDSDDDGLSDSMESYVYGTSPVNPDSDGDGLLDGQEIAWGLNPLIREIKSPSLWHEGFELPLVTPGSLSGQNGWTLSGDIKAVVTEHNSFKGNSSLSISGSFPSSSVDHDVTVDSDIVWIDMQLRNFLGKIGNSEMDSLSTVKFFATPQGYLVASDGAAMRTNNVLCVNDEEWNRFTLKLDYHTRRWDIYVNGVIALSNLHLFGDAKRISGISFKNGSGDADEIRVLNHRPLGLSSDGDPMSDEWELSSFGNLLRDGFGDFDGDGLSDAREFAAKTNPLLSDSDSDGIPDNWEVERGLDPLDAADAALDPDGDGMSNQLEYELGVDPWFFEPNPSEVKRGLYAEFFHTRGEMQIVPDVSKLEMLQTSIAKTISYCDGTWPDKVEQKGDLFAARFSGFVKIAKSGTYNFYVTSDDGFKLSIGGKKIIQDIAPHSARETASSVFLEKGWQPIELLYYENKEDAVLSLSWSGQGIPKALIPADCLCHIPPSPPSPPAGFSPGLVCSLYSLPGEITRMPDFSAVMATQTFVVEDIDIPATTSSWPMAPETMTNRFAAIFEGAIYASGCGRYVFSLSSDDGSRLFIDGELLIDNGGNHSMTEKTAAIALSEGLHDIRVEYYENEGEAGLKLSWGKEGDPVDVIHSGRFFHQSGILDTDSDGMPDWWEEMYDLNSVNPDDAAYDLDGDGVVNLQEYINGTNPRSSDTDSDAMPDGWEISNGLCPFANDAIADADNDGLVNVEEFRHGTNPMLVDTDGDWVKDGDERNMYFSDPTIADFTAIVDTNAVVAASAVDETFGDWVVRAGGVSLLGRSGTLFYTNDLVLSHAGVRQLRLSCEFAGKYDTELVCKVDGVRAGVARLLASSSARTTEAVFLTQWLNSGRHEMSFELQNFANESEFSLFDIAVCEPQGPDSDSNGILDWIDSRVRNSSVWRPGNVASKVSPYCLRGDSASEVLPSVLTSGGDLSVGRLPYHGWYADVPLSTSGETVVSVSYENGMKHEAVAVDWAEFDVTSEEDTVIRQGDSLLLSLGGATGIVEVDGTVVSSDGSAVPWRFNSCGDHSVTGRSGGSVRTVTVRVVTCTLPDSIPLWRGKTSSVAIPGSGFSDMYLSFGPDAALASAIFAGNVCTVALAVPAFGHPTSLSCEIENPDASVVASAKTLPFSVCYTLDGVYHVSHRLDAGTRVVENRLTAFGLPSGVELRMTGNSGICFEDGSGVLSLDCGDFDETGDCLYRFLVPEGVSNPCQFLHVYLDGKEFAQ